ncbi:MAG: HEAT repeat domain-containing protein [Gemmatimonadota bacterium]|nr:HEAT repeat domain-containing protein [Gemmatimonadota bacterium]
MITKSGLWLIILGFLGCASKADDWIQILEHPNAAERARAAIQIGEMGDRRAVLALIQTLKDREPQVRLAASEALGKLGDRQAVDSLIAIVHDPNVMVGLTAVEALGNIGGEKAVETLLRIAQEREGALSLGAIQSLGTAGGDRSIQALTTALTDKARDVRWVAALTLARIKSQQALAPLIEALPQADRELRRVMVWALNTINPSWRTSAPAEEAINRLIDGLKLPNQSRYQVVQVLSEMDAEWKTRADATMDFFVAQLANGDLIARMQAVEALGQIGDARIVPSLLKALKDPNIQVQYIAIKALGDLRDARAVEPLVEALEHRDPGIVSAAALALGELRDTRAVEPLITILSNTEHGVFRLGAIQTLGVLKDPRATALLTEQLDDTSVQVRRIATEALGEIGDHGAIAPLLKTLNDQSAEVRWAAADALGSIGDASVADSLISIIGKGRIWARRMVRVLDRLDANWREREATLQIETYFLEHIDHPEPEVQWRSAEALGEIATLRARHKLLQAMEQKRTMIIAAAHAFFIRNGISEAEPLLVQALHQYGTEEMALTYLNAGHPVLAKAAHNWARRQGMILLSSPEPGNIRWNSG